MILQWPCSNGACRDFLAASRCGYAGNRPTILPQPVFSSHTWPWPLVSALLRKYFKWGVQCTQRLFWRCGNRLVNRPIIRRLEPPPRLRGAENAGITRIPTDGPARAGANPTQRRGW